jgi:hypothetical protein
MHIGFIKRAERGIGHVNVCTLSQPGQSEPNDRAKKRNVYMEIF